jgi:hypothetical protein
MRARYCIVTRLVICGALVKGMKTIIMYSSDPYYSSQIWMYLSLKCV